MDSNDTPASGSRWEPAAGAVAPPPAPAGRQTSPLMKSKLALVAGAVALVAAGGIGGFVLGQSSSATAGTSGTGHFGGPPGMTGGEGGFSGQMPGEPAFAGTGTGTGNSTP